MCCRSTSATRIAHGNAALTRIPMACCANTFQRVLISACIAQMSSRRWRSLSTQGHEKPWDGKLLPKPLISIFWELNVMLRRPFESAQYASHEYQQLLAVHGIQSSMSRKGNCWDNAVAESSFATLKVELVDQSRWSTRTHARNEVFEYIELFYNRQRRHSVLGYMSPNQFEHLASRHALKPVLRLPATRLPHSVDIAGLRSAHARAGEDLIKSNQSRLT